MKKIIILILLLIPFIAFAELDFNLEDLLLEQTAPNITIKSIDLIWSTNTYTPLNYEGRKLPVIGSEVTIETIISASEGNPNTLKYSWFLEDIFQRNKSGYGKNKFSFYAQQRPGAQHNIKVQIFNDDRTIFEQRTIVIPIVNPEIIVYEHKDGDQGNDSFFVATDRKTSLIARPYFFSAKKLTDITFEWIFSGQEPIRSSDYRASILDLTISGKTNQIIENSLWINATSNDDPRQRASQSLNVKIY